MCMYRGSVLSLGPFIVVECVCVCVSGMRACVCVCGCVCVCVCVLCEVIQLLARCTNNYVALF